MMYRPGNGVNHSTTISIRPPPRVKSMYASAPIAELLNIWKSHIPSDFVVDQWASNIESRSSLDFLLLHNRETSFVAS
jgi:hypothetical protein